MALYTSPSKVRVQLPMDLPQVGFGDQMLLEHIEMWSGYIDDQLSGVYQTPFPAYPQNDVEKAEMGSRITPPSVQIACVLLVTHYMYTISGLATEKDDPRNKLWWRAHDILKQIREREIILGGGEDLAGSERSTAPMLVTGSDGLASIRNQNRFLGDPHRHATGFGFGVPSEEDREY